MNPIRILSSDHNRCVTALKYSPDWKFFASSCNTGVTPLFFSHILLSFLFSPAADQTCSIFNSSSYEKLQVLSGKHSEGINDLEWLHHPSYLATASDDKNILIWNIETV